MRRILVDVARRKHQVRHGGGQQRVQLEGMDIALPDDRTRLLQVHEALDELAAVDPMKAQVVKLRFFVGLTNGEIANLLHVSSARWNALGRSPKPGFLRPSKAVRYLNSKNNPRSCRF